MEKLQKIIAAAGICSRRAAEKLIEAGKVTVNGKPATLGDRADAAQDTITIDGKRIGGKPAPVYLMMNKPRGYVTSMHDEKGRRDVSTLLADCRTRVYPVGRLDYDSEGLLLFTNDGALTLTLTHPRHEVEKQYIAQVRGETGNLKKLSQPMELDGQELQPATVQILRSEEGQALIAITIHEGKNRQIRRMCEACGLMVKRLKRVAVGKIELDKKLKAGAWRYLTPEEIEYLTALKSWIPESKNAGE